MEVEVNLGNLIDEYNDKVNPLLTPEERANLQKATTIANRALLRVRAVLDPDTLSDQDWKDCEQTSFQLGIELDGEK
jgi:hypothetical protein